MRFWPFWACCLFFSVSCSNRTQKAEEPAGPPPNLWAHYKVWAAEGDSVATCMVQFFNKPQGRYTLILEEPSGVALDGSPLEPDSAGITGAYYEFRADLDAFAGVHRLTFTDSEGRNFVDSFYFRPFSLAAELPAKMSAGDHRITLNGLPDGSMVRLVLTDTAINNGGINELATVKDGSIQLPGTYLQNMKSGPVILQLFLEEDRQLRSRLPGELSVSYSLMRIFELEK